MHRTAASWREAGHPPQLSTEEAASDRPPAAGGAAGGEAALPREFSDTDATRLCVWMSREYGVSLTPSTAGSAVAVASQERRIEPVREYLQRIIWDGMERIDAWLVSLLGAEDGPYTRAVGSRWLISAVARTLDPGCKADCALVLEGGQGLGKSSALAALVPKPELFTDEIPPLGTKDAAIQCQDVWIVELSELDALTKTEIAAAKAFLSRSRDRYRAPFGKVADNHPRRCVIVGTTNQGTYLRDETGARRFWPVRVGVHPVGTVTQIVKAIAGMRDQLWAEAVARYHAGAVWYLDTPDLVRAASREQDDRYQTDAWEELVAAYINSPSVDAQGWTTIGDVLQFAVSITRDRWTRSDQMRAAACLQRLGWVRRRAQVGGKRLWRYYPLNPAEVGADVGPQEVTPIPVWAQPPQPPQPPQPSQPSDEIHAGGGRHTQYNDIGPVGAMGQVGTDANADGNELRL